MKMLILGASYGSLLSTKLLMAGHDVTLICRSASAALINSEGTEVRIKLRDEDTHRAIRSADLPGSLNAVTPEQARPGDYNMIALAMQAAGSTDPKVFKDSVLDVANAPGEKILPGELAKALQILKDGGDVDYVGATNVELIGPGEAAGTYREYEVKDGAYETVGFR